MVTTKFTKDTKGNGGRMNMDGQDGHDGMGAGEVLPLRALSGMGWGGSAVGGWGEGRMVDGAGGGKVMGGIQNPGVRIQNGGGGEEGETGGSREDFAPGG